VRSAQWHLRHPRGPEKSSGLTVGVDVDQALARLTNQKDPVDIYQDTDGQDDRSLEGLMSSLPMFKDELPLVEQVMVNYGNTIEPSPIVHPEIAGRGVECAHGRAAWKHSSQCQGVLADVKMLVLRACNNRTQPQSLMCKYERRTRDYIRSYRMGTSSKDLEKMRDEIKTHRNMLDYHTNFVRSERADDATDTTLLGYDAMLRIPPQKNLRAASQCQCFQPKPNLATQNCWGPTTTMPAILPRGLCAPMLSACRALIKL